MKIKRSRGERIFSVINYLILGLFAFICVYPLWHVAMASLSEGIELMKHTGILMKPAGFSIEAYKKLFSNNDILYGFRNTFILLILRIPLSVLMISLCAYVLSRPNLYFQKPILLFCMFTMYYNGGTIPQYLNFKDLGLIGSVWGLVFPFMYSTVEMLILRTQFQSVPQSLVDAARIDGAGPLKILFKVMMPLSKATLSVIVLRLSVNLWNSWFWESTLLNDEKMLTLQVVLRNLTITEKEYGASAHVDTLESLKYAAILISIIPILIVYPFVQKNFTKGVMIGAVKE